jgi:biotin carboxylase
MKTVLFLGASWFQLPPIIYAKRRGYRVVTCDNRPDNPGHALADVCLDVSTVDEEAVLGQARDLEVDGVVCYASDVSAPTAAQVAEALGLPGNPYGAVRTLTDKHRFRRHLSERGFPTPRFCTSGELDELAGGAAALELPLLVKPVDSSGSKGISWIDDRRDLPAAFQTALASSRSKIVIVEEVVRRAGYQLTGDGFLVDGRLAFSAFVNEHFSATGKPFCPVGESLPAAFDARVLGMIRDQVQDLVTGLGMQTGALNFDILLDEAGRVHLIEIGPRCGGNGIPLLIRRACGVDLPRAVVEAALGRPAPLEAEAVTRPHASYNVLDLLVANGVRDDEEIGLRLDHVLSRNVVYQHFELRSGELLSPDEAFTPSIAPFRPCDLAVGFLLFEFGRAEDMLQTMDRMHDLLRIERV